MIFALIYILAIFQDYMNKILAKKMNIFAIIYLNNIFIYIKKNWLYLSCILHFWAIEKIFSLCKHEKMLILIKIALIPSLYSIFIRNLYQR